MRAIFDLYLEHEALLPVVARAGPARLDQQALDHPQGASRRRQAVQQDRLHQLLTNVLYIGKVRYKDEVHRASTRPSCRSKCSSGPGTPAAQRPHRRRGGCATGPAPC